jgi:hypothetical protein
MAKQQIPKKRRGRPPKFGPRRNFNFRLSEQLHERLIDCAEDAGRSLSEELEMRITRDFAWEDSKGDIDRMRAEMAALHKEANVEVMRLAALQILREIEGKPRRVIIDFETLLAARDGIARGLKSGFVDPDAPPQPPHQPLALTAEEERRLLEELAESRRMIDEAVERTRAADEAAKKPSVKAKRR